MAIYLAGGCELDLLVRLAGVPGAAILGVSGAGVAGALPTDLDLLVVGAATISLSSGSM